MSFDIPRVLTNWVAKKSQTKVKRSGRCVSSLFRLVVHERVLRMIHFVVSSWLVCFSFFF